MKPSHNQTPFVVVGGLGGSGTRVVAQAIQKMGFYLGPVLNPQLDNLLFTLLFKRRDWFREFPKDVEIERMFEIFAIAMLEGVECAFEKLAPGEAEELFEKTRGMGVNRPEFDAILSSAGPNSESFSGVAWKEPNTHIFLPQLARQFPNMKYIHVMRHGLDMALSGNRQQLVNWGNLFGIRENEFESPVQTQLRYWLAANNRALELGESMPEKQFFVLNYDALCLCFEAEIYRLQRFLERALTSAEISQLSKNIAPESIGRFRNVATDTFTLQQREAVQQLGFCIE